jgi:MoaD family protein
MRLKLKLLKPFKDSVGKSEVGIETNATNVEGLLIELSARYPKLKPQIVDSKGKIDYSVNAIINSVPVTDLKEKIKENDEITLFVPVGGG